MYVSVDDEGLLQLTTDNGDGPSNIIYLEPEVYDALVAYVERHRKAWHRPMLEYVHEELLENSWQTICSCGCELFTEQEVTEHWEIGHFDMKQEG